MMRCALALGLALSLVSIVAGEYCLSWTLYDENFEGGIGNEWTGRTLHASLEPLGWKALGPLKKNGNGEAALSLTNIPLHSTLDVKMTLAVASARDGSQDKFTISVDGNAIAGSPFFIKTSYTPSTDLPSANLIWSGDLDGIGDTASNAHRDDKSEAVYETTFSVEHTADQSTLSFGFDNDPTSGEESVYIVNITVSLTHCFEAAPVCNLEEECTVESTAVTCNAEQSTFEQWGSWTVDEIFDDSTTTCMQTAVAAEDEQEQYLMVDLQEYRLVGTVRFVSEGSEDDFVVKVSSEEAGPGKTYDQNNKLVDAQNPTFGGKLPDADDMEGCTVKATSGGTFEATCPPATMGRYVYVMRAAAKTSLKVCDFEVFSFECMALNEEVGCPIGYEPANCTSRCSGCVPCQPGFYSDKAGDYTCTPCPGASLNNIAGGLIPGSYSPPGSSSVFQCEGDLYVDGTSTLDVVPGGVVFDQALDAWHIDVMYSQAWHIQVNGVSSLYLSDGGDDFEEDIYAAANFPCRADTSQDAGDDLSISLEETMCCLQNMRQDYLMTKIFRDWTDDLNLVAANDVCDAEDGSNLIVNADLSVVGAGTEFVGVDGSSFANKITIEPIPVPAHVGYYEGLLCARITIPDAELFKVSRHSPTPAELPVDDETTYLKDQRELFVGLLDMLPTGTRVVDSANQQISIKLTRTQYGTFAAYGEQNIDYDFISYLNARAHKVISTTEELSRRDLVSDQHYLEVTYVYDDRLSATDEAKPITDLDSVTLTIGDDTYNPCADSLPAGFEVVVDGQDCGPTKLDFGANKCPQVSLPDDKFGRIYIPLPLDKAPYSGAVSVSFDLDMTDATSQTAQLEVSMDIAVGDFVSWCDDDVGDIDLAERVVPAITIGTSVNNPPRLALFSGDDPEEFSTGAETLQDGLITLELSLKEEDGLDDNLEVFMEDVLVVQINPGSDVTIADFASDTGPYIPTFTYDPDTRDATLNIPDELKEDCPEALFSESFFGCVHKHVLAEEEVTNPEWSYLVGSADDVASTGAQDFMETMLGSGTAAVAARELGRDYEEYLEGEQGFGTRKKIGLWINPGHEWGQTVHNSDYSLSEHVVVYVLFGVRSGVDGTERRMLLQASKGGRTTVVSTVTYDVTAAGLVEDVLGDTVVATEVRAELALSEEEACKPQAELLEWCASTLKAALAPHSSPIEAVQCVSVDVQNADCDNSRRASGSPSALVDAVVALAASADAKIDMEAVVASGAVVSMQRTGGKTLPGAIEAPTGTPDSKEEEEEGGSSNSGMVIGAAVGAAVGVLVLGLVAWKASRGCGSPQPLTTVSVVERQISQKSDKDRLEEVMFEQ